MPSAVFNGNYKRGHLCLVPDLKGTFHIFTVNYYASSRGFAYNIHYSEEILFYS